MGAQDRRLSVQSAERAEVLDELQEGTPLGDGRYICQDFLGADGFGITYLASSEDDRDFVIRECFPSAFCRREGLLVKPRSQGHQAEVALMVRLFADEARHLFKIGHPNIVGIREIFEENDTAYVVMDFVNGRDLLELSQDDEVRLTPAQTRKHLERMLDAIGAVHRYGLLHRDISPVNIIVREDGEPVLIDFGAAREQAVKASRILSVLRSLRDAYSPQEFYISGSEQGPSCDLYSLAASFYHVVAGELSPGSQQRLAARASGRPDPYVPLAEKTTDFDAEFCAALDKAMSIMPEARFQSAEAWLEAMAPKPVAVALPEPLQAAPRRGSPQTEEDSPADEMPGDAAFDDKPDDSADEQKPSDVSLPETPEEFVRGMMRGDLAHEEVEHVKPRRRLPGLLLRGTALAAMVGAVLVLYPDVFPGDDPIDAMITGPLPGFVTDTTARVSDDRSLFVTFEPVARSARPTPLPVTFSPETHGILADVHAAPQPLESRESESTRIAAAPLLIQSLDQVTEDENVDPPQTPPPSATDRSFGAADVVAHAMGDAPIIGSTIEADTPEVIEKSPTAEIETTAPALSDGQVVAPALGAEQIASTVRPDLPFALDPTDSGLIASVADDAPSWMAPGSRISSVNDAPILTLDQDTPGLLAGLLPGAAETDISFGVIERFDQAAVDRVLTVRVVHEMQLPNGLGFEAHFEDGSWITRVTAAHGDVGLVEGDVMTGFVRDGRRIDSPEALVQIIEAELAEGRTSFAFAVRRDGMLWVETFTMPPLNARLPVRRSTLR
jgi:serine/threonine protein kinase